VPQSREGRAYPRRLTAPHTAFAVSLNATTGDPAPSSPRWGVITDHPFRREGRRERCSGAPTATECNRNVLITLAVAVFRWIFWLVEIAAPQPLSEFSP
jgi:hypothetical protein